MTLSQSLSLPQRSFANTLKIFFMWTLTLTVCWLVVGFPVVALGIIGGALLAMCLQVILPTSAIVVVAGVFLALNGTVLMVAAALLTLWDLKPHQVPIFSWLQTPAKGPLTSFAACPLTCALTRST